METFERDEIGNGCIVVQKFKDGSIFVETSEGGMVLSIEDSKALIEFLVSD